MNGFVQTPNIPAADVSLCMIDGRAPRAVTEMLKSFGADVIPTGRCDGLYEGVSYHPDMLFNHLGGREIVAPPNAPEATVLRLKSYGFEIIEGSTPVYRKYPYDTAYNVARIGELCVCNAKHTDRKLMDRLYDAGAHIIDVKQGYTRCSICIVDDHSIITSDEGVYGVLRKYDLDILKIRPGFIELPGLDYGFIGGSSGLISSDRLFFVGNISLHPDRKKIERFLREHNKKMISVYGCNLLDVGGVMPLMEIRKD